MIELDFTTTEEREAAAAFLAALFKQGIVFKARPHRSGTALLVTMEGY